MRWVIVLIFVILLFALCGCSAKSDRVVLSQQTKIEVLKPDPRLLENNKHFQALPYGLNNSDAAQIINSNNTICLDNTDKLESLQAYTIKLLNSLKVKEDQVLVK